MKEVILALFLASSVTDAAYSSRDLRCSVCKVVVQEMEKEISKVNPNKRINLGHRIDEKGKVVDKTKQFARSEIHLSELMDGICEKMENYVRAINKKTKNLEVIPLITDSGAMNPHFGEYEVVQDTDLNQSLKFNKCTKLDLVILNKFECDAWCSCGLRSCEGIVEEFDAEISGILREKRNNSDVKVCVEATGLCDDASKKRNAEL